MIETRTEATVRWRREGRDKEVSAFRKRAEEELKAGGMAGRKAGEEAFKMAVAAFPPIEVAGGGSSGAWGEWEDRIGEAPLPEAWGTLPDSAPFDAEVEWVHQNMVLVIEERANKRPVFHWECAQKPAPSHGARNLMMFAATNRAGFMKILQSLKPGMGGEEELVRQEKVKVEEIRRILEELRQKEVS